MTPADRLALVTEMADLAHRTHATAAWSACFRRVRPSTLEAWRVDCARMAEIAEALAGAMPDQAPARGRDRHPAGDQDRL